MPCLIANLPAALADHRLFSRVLAVLTCLWKHWRLHVRMEITVLVESIVIRTMTSDNRPIFRMMAVRAPLSPSACLLPLFAVFIPP